MFGGNSNWRGPVWSPINVMLIRALLNLHIFFGDDSVVECPTGSGRQLNLYEVAREISDRLTGTFPKDADGHRPVQAGSRSCRLTPTGATWCCSMSTSTATTGPASPLASLRRHKLTPSRRRSISPSTGSAGNKSLGGPRHEYQVAA